MLKPYLLALLFISHLAQAFEVQRFSPQGEVKNTTQVTAVFSEDMVKLGDTAADNPFDINCPAVGNGRWSNPKTWQFYFDASPKQGQLCSFKLKPQLKAQSGSSYIKGNGSQAKNSYEFFVSAPWLSQLYPADTNLIEQDQAFVVDLPFALDPQSLAQHAWCETEGLSERLPFKLLDTAQTKSVLNQIQPNFFSAHAIVFSCQRPLPAGSKMKVVWDKGLQSSTGLILAKMEQKQFTVKPAFRAELTCSREKPGAPCSPLSDLVLSFTNPVHVDLAQKVKLVSPTQTISPQQVTPVRRAELMKQNAELFYRKHAQVNSNILNELVFKGPFNENTLFKIELPANFVDFNGQALANASSFPLTTKVGVLPPLAKFSADFGVIEQQEGGVLPVTVRNIDSKLEMRVLRKNDANSVLPLMQAYQQFQAKTKTVKVKATKEQEAYTYEDYYYPRELSFLSTYGEAETSAFPKISSQKSFEVLGIPLKKPGFYVVEVKSQTLGKALLNPAKPMYVRTQALVTNLSVHLKKGRENSVVWVTSLSTGKPVNGAQVAIYDCRNQPIWQATTNAQGLATYEHTLPELANCERDYVYTATANLGDDFSFVRSDWNQGIEPWRFNVDTWAPEQSHQFATVLDRTMLRAGETLSMKHFARDIHYNRYDYAKQLPQRATIELIGGDYSVELPLNWNARATATSQWNIPKDAKMGTYGIKMAGAYDYVAEFKVSEFRLPAYKGSVQSKQAKYAGVKQIPVDFSLAYLNGGSASGQTVQVSSMLKISSYDFANYPEFSFQARNQSTTQQLLLDKQEVKLNAQGLANLSVPLQLKPETPLTEPMRVQTEMTFSDPNGEIQTISGSTEIWPAKVAVGLKISDWAGLKGTHHVQAIALDMQGKPVSGATIKVTGVRKWDFVHRKRIIGGFYSYDTEENQQDLGQLCEGKTDKLGLLDCQMEIKEPGNVELLATSKDSDGAQASSTSGFWVSDDADFWFGQSDEDRIEVIPEKREYQAGETARIQVHTPFYYATALIAVEREGVLKTFIQPLYRRNAVVEIPIESGWGPNVFVSALVVRGRVDHVPWYSFFEWGWHSPVDWVKAKWHAPAPTALVDLAKPAFKFGLTRIAVGTADQRLQVAVSTNKPNYQPREMVTANVQVNLPNGKPVPAGSEVAIAAVDQALLELSPNPTWNLLDQMLAERAYLIETSTAQMQVVGKRHFGKKALPAGGGGGKLSSRELFDTLLYWNPRVTVNAQGMATVKFPVNDSLTAFKVVAVADAATQLFGTGSVDIQSRQDLQLISGIPPMVREGDQYQAMMTVRNATDKAMQVVLEANVGKQTLDKKNLNIAANSASDVQWSVRVPDEVANLTWQIQAVDSLAGKKDALKLTQQVLPRVPVTVQQASFMQLEAPYSAQTAMPQGGLAGKGGLNVQLSASLANQTAGVTRYFEAYPYSCLEQQTSIAAGLNDHQRWASVVANLSSYQDAQGYLSYFPGMVHGSDALTNYVLTMAYENHVRLPAEVEQKMRTALLGFIEGRQQPFDWVWGDNAYLTERRISALAALSYTGSVKASQLSAFAFDVANMPTNVLIDWYAILKHVPDAAQRESRLQAINQALHNRMQTVGGRLVFDQEENDTWYWAMVDGELNATRLITLVMDDPAWKNDMVGLMRGALLRQNKGHWHSTLANAWGRLAMAKFGATFEKEAVTGKTSARLNQQIQSYNWPAESASKVASPNAKDADLYFAWPKASANSTLNIQHVGTGKPWANLLVSAAIPDLAKNNGYKLRRTVTAISQKTAGQWSRGDLMRVRLDVDSQQAMNWVALSDPIPAGASILGNTARDSNIAQLGENQYDGTNNAYPSYTERGLAFYRAYFEYVPKGHFWVEYTVRLNNPGVLNMPETRVEAMYAPELFAQVPNAVLKVQATPSPK